VLLDLIVLASTDILAVRLPCRCPKKLLLRTAL